MDNRSLLSQHSRELNSVKDMGSNRNQQLVKNWVHSISVGNALNAISESNLSRSHSSVNIYSPNQDSSEINSLKQRQFTVQTVNQYAQLSADFKIDFVGTENLDNVAGNLNHREMLSLYTLPRAAISIFLLLSRKHSIGNNYMLNLEITKLLNRQIVNQVVVIIIQGTTLRRQCTMFYLNHFYHLCNRAGQRQLLW